MGTFRLAAAFGLCYAVITLYCAGQIHRHTISTSRKRKMKVIKKSFLLYLEQLLMINVSRYILVGRMTRFVVGRPGNRGLIVVSGYSFCSFPKDSNRLWGPFSCQWVPRATYPGVKRSEGLRLTTHLQLVSRLRMNGVPLLLPPYAFMEWT